MSEFLMPKLGADMSAGTLVAWHKKPGDVVCRGDILADVETDKGVISVETFGSGVLERLLVNPGDRVPVGALLAVIHDEASGTLPAVSAAASPPPAPASEVAAATSRPAAPTGRPPVSPAARRLARELGVDPATLVGSGSAGAVTREDVVRAAEASRAATAHAVAPAAADGASQDRTARMRGAIAAAMARSKREIPHYYLQTSIDIHNVLAWLAEANRDRPLTERLLPAALLLKAVALGLREVPEFNALWEGDHAVARPDIHVGVAISLRQGGLVAPAIHHTDRLSLDELMARFRDLVNRARAGALRASEMTDPTITVTSMGDQGVETVFGIIYPPQVALVGFGKLVERAWSVEGAITSRPIVQATLSADHRASDGHRGGLLLAAIDHLLQEPQQL